TKKHYKIYRPQKTLTRVSCFPQCLSCDCRQWYRRNFTITFLMARVTLQNMWNNLSPANGGEKNDPIAI
uniref:Uncharacterized protein n=1 Tax=Neogobius melanostomus TaxID=47308 RepID=A0A8C6ST58_9GOBI